VTGSKKTIKQLTAALTPTEELQSMDSFLTQLPLNIEKLDTLEGALKRFNFLKAPSENQATNDAVQERVNLVCAWQQFRLQHF
jgi:hypothetical protein